MADREKVMQWLETCVSGCEEGCPYEYKNLVYRVECKADLMREALAMLKEQPEIIRCKDCKHYDSETQSCNDGLDGIFLPDWFCADGERAVKWDD